MGFKIDYKYGSHLPVLLKAVSITSGPVLEMGSGLFSTPVLHWLCCSHRRRLLTLEHQEKYLTPLMNMQDEYHELRLVTSWDEEWIEQPWDVVLIDHAAHRRKIDLMRVADYAQYIVCHDTLWRDKREYHYEDVLPSFKYRYDYTCYPPANTTVVSNFVDVRDFHV